jgi:hypothetical protein
MRGAIPEAFTGPSNNAPVRVAAWDSDGDGIAEAILAVQGPIGTSGEIQQFEITGTSPFLYQQAPPLSGFSGPWFIATSENATSGTNSPGPLPDQSIPALDWTNTVNAYDVNNDGLATPLDVLETINYINTHPGETALPAEQFVPPRFFDCNADLVITAEDVLFVLNSFNRSLPYSGEGERSQPIGDAAGISLPLDAGRGPVANPSRASLPEGERNETRDAAAFALVAGGEWTVPEGQVPSPLVPYSSKPPIDDFRLFEWEAVLDDIAAEIAAL